MEAERLCKTNKVALPWSTKEVETLKRLYPRTRTAELSHILGRSRMAIRVKASLLKVKADNAYHHINNPEINQYDSLSQAERAYIAGIIDGEGTIGWQNHHTKYTPKKRYTYRLPYISISNTNEELMRWLHARLKGSLCRALHKNPKWAPCWGLHLRGNLQVKKLLIVLLPYLIVKKEKAAEILNHHTTFEYIAS